MEQRIGPPRIAVGGPSRFFSTSSSPVDACDLFHQLAQEEPLSLAGRRLDAGPDCSHPCVPPSSTAIPPHRGARALANRRYIRIDCRCHARRLLHPHEDDMSNLPLWPNSPPSQEPFSRQTAGEGLAAPRRHRHRERLPLLRRRLRPAHLHQGRAAHRHRGQPRQPDQRGHALPQGGQQPSSSPSTRTASQHVLYRAPYSDHWETRPLDWALDRIAQPRQGGARRRLHGHATRTAACSTRVTNIGTLGGATLDNEENYLIKKLFGGGLGVVSIENQARI